MQTQAEATNEGALPCSPADSKRSQADRWLRGLRGLAAAALSLVDAFILWLYWDCFVTPLGVHRLDGWQALGLWVLLRFVIRPPAIVPEPPTPAKAPLNAGQAWSVVWSAFQVRLGLICGGALIHGLMGGH